MQVHYSLGVLVLGFAALRVLRYAVAPPPRLAGPAWQLLDATGMHVALVLLSGCGAGISDRPCPRVTEFPAEVQRQAAAELATASALARMMDAIACA